MDISELRQEINIIDEQLLSLLNKRAELAVAIGREKHMQGLNVLDTPREKAIIQRMLAQNEGPVSDMDVQNIFSLVIQICRNLQNNS